MKNKALRNFVIICLAIILGLGGGFVGFVYLNLPKTDELNISEQNLYSNIYATNTSGEIPSAELTGADDELSIHFLELGNKYTGDCTFIHFGEIDILIDCGSKTTSIPVVTNYINQFMKDNILEYVIVTHAHLDHYAGFATSSKVNGIFDLYECKNIIDFGEATNQTSKT